MSNAFLPKENKIKKVLMLVRAFPPFLPVGHSIRAVKFIKYLPALGWLPVVLTIDDQKDYENTRKMGSETLLSEIEPRVKIYRTTAGEPSLKFLEKEMEFSQRNSLTRVIVKLLGGVRRWVIRNVYMPDRLVAWLPFALRCGQLVVKNEGIDVIFATCPPHSVVLIGACLKRLTGKPLVLDFRDDWIDTPWHHSKPAIRRWIERRLESWAVKTADKVILVTEWSQRSFQNRYPKQRADKFVFISNGCDLDDFTELNSTMVGHNPKFTILHAGSLNDSKSWGRSPIGLFQAIQHILQKQPELAEKLTLIFAGDFPEGHRKLAEEMGLSDVVKGLGHLPHDEVLRLIKSADLLLAINYEGFSTLIPGKIYEYWAVGDSPILYLSCPGAAQELIEKRSLGITVSPDDVPAIEQAVITIYRAYASGSPIKVSNIGIEGFDRKVLSERLAQTLSNVTPSMGYD